MPELLPIIANLACYVPSNLMSTRGEVFLLLIPAVGYPVPGRNWRGRYNSLKEGEQSESG